MSKMTDFSGKPHSGVVPYPVIGVVTDNVDPDEYARIRVSFPTLEGEPKSWWIRQSAPMAGKERGFYTLPEVGDEVLVVFLQGAQDVGVIIGQFWNGKDLPPKECKDKLPGPDKTHKMKWSKDTFTDGTKDLAKNDRRFWKSRSGHLFVFDDSAGKESVQIWDKSHTLAFVFDTKESRILLTNSKGDIHIRTEKDLYLESGQNLIYKVGKDVKGEVAMNVGVKVGTNYKLEVGAMIDVKSGANTTIKAGAMMTLQASATNTIKGAMVLIN